MRILLVLLLLMTGCENGDAGITIEGSYARYGSSEYSRAWDTLNVSRYENAGHTYLIQRRTGIERINSIGLLLPFELREEEMTGNYDPVTQQLQELKNGRVFTFREGELLLGTAVYKRISR